MGKENYIVDTKNLCFICYRPAKIVAAGVKRRVKDKTFSLRCLSRYMNVDFQRMAETLSSPQSHDVGRKFPQVLVTVCSRCSTLTEEFSTLYQYLEFTQMKITACVRSINELMNKTESNARLVEKFRKKMSTTKGNEAEIVENVRKSMMENCSSVLRKSLPRVKIVKYGENVSGRAKISTRPGHPFVKPSPRSKKPGFSSTILKSESLKIKDFSATRKGNVGKNPGPEKNEAGGLFQCLHCDSTFKNTEGLQIHIVGYHREQFFAMFRSSSVSDEEFKVAVELLFQDVRKITANSGAQSTVSYVCSCCGKPFSSQIDTYVHMVQLHYDVLSTKLQSFQKDSSMLASAKKTVYQHNPSVFKRYKRGPYRKKNKLISNNVTADPSITDEEVNLQIKFRKMKPELGFPRTCECGVLLSSRQSWNNHQRLNCKLKVGVPKLKTKTFVPTAKFQHPSLKRAKNTVGFPRTCACGVRLSLRSSWNNHQRLHCKLKLGKSPFLPEVTLTEFGIEANQTAQNTMKMKKKKMFGGASVVTSKKTKITNKFSKRRYECDCGAVVGSYQTWYYHKNKACKLRNDNGRATLDQDYIEEIPIDVTPSGDLCLPSTSTSIEETSPVPKILKVTSQGGVIKGLHSFVSFRDVKKEEVTEANTVPETKSYSEMFLKFCPVGTSSDDVTASLQKVLLEYRKFPGNISGCPFCGRGFSQVAELQNHMVGAHFDDVLHKLRNLIDPSGMAQYDGTINVDPSIVKRENEMEIDFSTDLSVENLQHSQDLNSYNSHIEEDELGKVALKEEVNDCHNVESTTNEGDEALHIIPP